MAVIFSDWGMSKKPLTYSSVKEAKSAYRESVKAEKTKAKVKKTRTKTAKARSQRWEKSYKFSRKSPLAKRLRKIF